MISLSQNNKLIMSLKIATKIKARSMVACRETTRLLAEWPSQLKWDGALK
jgi:hypothetical protein